MPRTKAATDIALRGVGEVMSSTTRGMHNLAIASSYDEALQMSGGNLTGEQWLYQVDSTSSRLNDIILENTTPGQRTMAELGFGILAGKVVDKFIDHGKLLTEHKPFHPCGEVISVDRDLMKSKGWVEAYKESFPSEVNWTASTGTLQTYKVHQRSDINWDRVRTGGDFKFIGKTNREAAISGVRPQLEDGSFISLHHVGQNALGPLVETSTKLHSFDNKQAFKILHNQFPGKKHPDFPVDHGNKWQSDVKEYWKWRIKNDG